MIKNTIESISFGQTYMDENGRILIPKNMLRNLDRFQDENHNVKMLIFQNPEGTILLCPIGKSNYMESDSETLKMAIHAFQDIIEGRYLTPVEVDKLLKK